MPERQIERHPDKRHSDGEFWYLSSEHGTTLLMEVRGLGAIRMRATEGHEDGKLRFEGVALTTHEEILFD